MSLSYEELIELNKDVLARLEKERPSVHRTLLRWFKGKEQWNAWAEEMLARRKELEEKGEWKTEKDSLGVERGLNKATQEWLADTEADFSSLQLLPISEVENQESHPTEKQDKLHIVLVKNISFENFIFPSVTNFRNTDFSGLTFFWGATFSGEADFQHATFSSGIDFMNVTFSGKASFEGAIFSRETSFIGVSFSGVANFLRATFSRHGAVFLGATFFSQASFLRTIFSGNADFRATTFSDMLIFQYASFSSNVVFWSATFSGEANFWGATFSGVADFGRATFSGGASFWDTTFSGEACFRLSTFKEPVDFSAARFGKDAVFSAINSQKSFNLRDVRFRIVPDFSEAAFHAPPVLDEVRIEDQLRKRGGRFSFRSLPDVVPEKARDVSRRFRALGKMAHEARDWLNEMEFFAQEIRVRRFGLDFPLGEWRGLRKGLAWVVRKLRLRPVRQAALQFAQGIKASPWCGPRVGRFWFGWFYELLSDFGRSFARPVAWWVASLFGFALLYWWWAQWSASFRDVIAVSFRQGLVVSGLVRSGHYQHLLTEVFGSVPGKPNIPDLPHWLFFWMNVQTVLSAFFLFLFFLAVRNHFRIR